MTETQTDKPRTIEQVQFVPSLRWEEVEAMWRQAVADGGYTMTYAERAREVLTCVGTAAHDRLTATQQEHLKFIGELLILWEGALMLMESAAEEKDRIIEARGQLLGFAQAKITELQTAR